MSNGKERNGIGMQCNRNGSASESEFTRSELLDDHELFWEGFSVGDPSPHLSFQFFHVSCTVRPRDVWTYGHMDVGTYGRMDVGT
jgi:hypothetical protein